jgi:uncharacterized Tic20 family protein
MASEHSADGNFQPNDPYDGEELDSEAKTWGMLCHLAAFAGYVIPFGNIFGPLVVWLIKKDQSAFVDYHGKESVNFQLTITIAAMISAFLCLVLIGLILLPVVLLFDLIMKVIAAVKASNGERFRYPLSIRFIT